VAVSFSLYGTDKSGYYFSSLCDILLSMDFMPGSSYEQYSLQNSIFARKTHPGYFRFYRCGSLRRDEI